MDGCLTNSLVDSVKTSLSHFWPLWRENAHLSDANQAETAARPKEVNAVKTVVNVEVI
jgi:hypothetical protein